MSWQQQAGATQLRHEQVSSLTVGGLRKRRYWHKCSAFLSALSQIHTQALTHALFLKLHLSLYASPAPSSLHQAPTSCAFLSAVRPSMAMVGSFRPVWLHSCCWRLSWQHQMLLKLPSGVTWQRCR